MTRYTRRADAVTTSLPDGETALLDLATQQYYTLNETGAWLWERLAEPHDADALALALTQAFDVDPATARSGVDALLEHFLAEGLVAPV